MYRFDALRHDDLAALFRLTGEVGELPADKAVRRTHVMAALLKLIDGRSILCLEMATPDEGPYARPGSILHVDPGSEAEARGIEHHLVHDTLPDPILTEFRHARGGPRTMVRSPADDPVWYRSDHYNLVRRPFQIDHSLYCRATMPDGTDLRVAIQRCPGDPRFTDRDRAMIELLHTHAPHVYHAPAPSRPELDALAPRLRPVMRYLLQGDAEKEVAMKLKLSKHTVHRYTQVIYRELNVNTRAELLAKYARGA